MTDFRCFQFDEVDLDILRDTPRDETLINGYTKWVRCYGPQVDSVIGQIALVFADTTLGDGVSLLEAKAMDDHATESKRAALRSIDEHADWNRISDSTLEECYVAPWFLDPQGFVFYLPAFLIASLRDKHEYGFIEHLYRMEEIPAGWTNLLTVNQFQAIVAALQLVRQHPEYWNDRTTIDAWIKRHGD